MFTYQDFTRRGAENVPSTFRVQDYSWDDHGFSLVNRLYNDVGHLLDLKFRAAYNLTYFTMADKTNVDTSKFRRAIWNYIQCIYGIRHDDYDYGEVNQVSKTYSFKRRTQIRVFVLQNKNRPKITNLFVFHKINVAAVREIIENVH